LYGLAHRLNARFDIVEASHELERRAPSRHEPMATCPHAETVLGAPLVRFRILLPDFTIAEAFPERRSN